MHPSSASTKKLFDVAIVGGGIVGCATARHLKLIRPELNVVLLEKEDQLAVHQSGHNSGVLHAGIYYAPGSMKAKLCVEGIDMAYEYLDTKKIPYKRCGKLIVAVDQSEVPRLDTLFQRARQNNCKGIELVDSSRIKEIEPYCQGVKAIWSSHTGIVDWALVTRSFASDFQHLGGAVLLGWTLGGIQPSDNPEYPIRLTGSNQTQDVLAKYLITCAGLQSDRVAQLTGCSSLPKIVPFRGEYLKLKPEKRHLVKQANIYPVPDPQFPFLGVHFTPTIYGDVLLGPNAVLALRREGYHRTDFSWTDFKDAIFFKGMQNLMAKYAAFGIGELYRSLFVSAQVKLLQRYIPELRVQDVEYARAGVRAQAMDERGNLVEDFVFDSGQGPLAARLLHVRNAPSPGATSSMAIAKMVVAKSEEKFGI